MAEHNPVSAEPPSPALAQWLRGRVLALRQSTTRRRFPARLEVLPAEPTRPDLAEVDSWDDVTRADDHALRVDLLIRLLDRAGEAADSGGWPDRSTTLVYVRPGPVELIDSDLGWWSAALGTRGIAALTVVRLVTVTRWGWWDVASGGSKVWIRLRR